MRAAVITAYGGPEVLQIVDVEPPAPAADEVRVQVYAAGLNRADILQRLGQYPAPVGVPAMIPGLEIAGTVEAAGSKVHRWKVGDRVFGIVGGGASAEQVITAEDLLAPIPENLDYVQAAAVPEVFMTAYDALFNQAELSLGDRVLVHAAASGVGTAAIQLARAAGATTWGTTRTYNKRASVLAVGAAGVFDPDRFVEEAQQATGGRGMDIIIDFVGAPYLARNVEALAMRGRMVIVGTMGGAEGTVNLGMLMSKRLRIHGTVLRSRPRAEKAELTASFGSKVVPLLAQGVVRPIVDRVFPLHEIAAAHAYMESNASVGKIVLQMA